MFLRWLKIPRNKSLLLLGPRRVGKSTILKFVFPDYKYVTLDDLDDLNDAKRDPKGFVEKLGTKFVIDEAQREPSLTLPIKKLIDEKKIKAILTGSSGMRLREHATDTLAGRIEILQLPPCCFGEHHGPVLGNFFDIDGNERFVVEGRREINEYLKYGGFPEILVDAQNPDEKENILKNYKNTYFTRDLALLSGLEHVEGIRAMFYALIRGITSRYEISSLAKESALSVPTTKKYLNTMLESGLCFKLYGYHLGLAKRYISSAKIYFIDNGLITSLSGEASSGQIFENFIVSEIEKRRRIGQIDCDEIFYYESIGGAEIDLIVEEKHLITVIEIKAARSISGRDLKNIREFNIRKEKKMRKIIFYGGDKRYQENDIDIIPGYFLYRTSWV